MPTKRRITAQQNTSHVRTPVAVNVLPWRRLRLHELVVFAVFSLLFASNLVLGGHIVITGDHYSGTASENYISPYSAADMLLSIAYALVSFFVFAGLYLFLCYKLPEPLSRQAVGKQGHVARRVRVLWPYKSAPVRVWLVLLVMVICFVAWLPYLLVYWPGFVFGDSTGSLNLILGTQEWSSHHPILFTLILWACYDFALFMGWGITEACAVFCVIQMLLMGATFGYLIAWLRARFTLSKVLCGILVLLYAGNPYVATYSIALWKDPLFSCALVVLTLLLADFACSRFSRAVLTSASLVRLAVFGLLVTMLRNNGWPVVMGLAVVLLALAFVAWRKRSARRIDFLRTAFAAALPCCIGMLLMGPVSIACGVQPTEKVESYSIELSQMARVVVYDGNLSSEDRAFMNELLPLDQYKGTYAPCCIDSLKWSSSFNDEAFEQTSIWPIWFSMLVKNPVTYFEAWELMTYGYWTVNEPTAITDTNNIVQGNPHLDDFAEVYGWRTGIERTNLLGGDSLRGVFPISFPSIPVGWLVWVYAFMTLCCVCKKRALLVIPLIPCALLILSMLVASPIWYWQRYVVALQFLLPVFLVLFAGEGCVDD